MSVAKGGPADAAAPSKRLTGSPSAKSRVSALRKARATGEPTEVLEERSESQRVLANPDGSMTLEDYVQPKWVKRSDGWIPVDTSLVRKASGVLAPKATSADLSFSGGGDSALVTIAKGGDKLSLAWPWKLPTPVVDGDTATYPEAIPGVAGVDLRLRAGSQGFSEQVIVKTREAAADPKLAQVRFTASIQGGGSLRSDGEGDIDFADSAGTSLFHAPTPMMWDSAGGTGSTTAKKISGSPRVAAEEPGESTHQAQMDVSLSGQDLVVAPDQTMMRSPDTQFPVVLDPDWTTSKLGSKGTAWADVSSSGLHSYNGSEWKQVKVGHYEGWPGSPSSDTYRAFFKYNVSKALHKKIISAEFHAFLDRSFTCTESAVELWQTKAFSSSTRWSNKPALVAGSEIASSKTSGGEPGCDAHDVKLNATKAVTGNASSVYLALKGGSESSHSYKYFSNVYLTVNFDSYPTVSGLGMSNPKTGCGSSTAPIVVGNSKPSLVATILDPDPENPHADFEVWSGATGGSKVASKTTAGAKSGSQHSMALPDTALVDGQTFRWRVTPVDTAYAGTPSGWCFYSIDRTAPESAPGVTSDLKDLDSGESNDAIGRTATFTFAPNGATGVTNYRYAWNDDAAAGAANAPSVPAGTDGTAKVTLTVPFTPDITFRLYVFSFDKASNRSANPGVFEFQLSSPSGPVGHWTLDETSGTALSDSAGTNNATLNGGAPGASGRVQSGVGFNGTTDYAETSGPVLRTDKSFTVTAWVRLENTKFWATAVSQDGTPNSAFYLQYSLEENRWAMAGCGTRATSLSPPVLNRWTHLTGVYDAAAKQDRLYVDGALQKVIDCPAPRSATDGPLVMGRGKFDNEKVDFFPGTIDDVQVYDRVVYDTEPNAIDGSTGGIADLANRPTVQEGYWTGDLGSGTTVADSSGRGHDATLSSATAWTADGQVDGALNLNDANKEHATIAAPVVQTDSGFTVTAWARPARLPSGNATVLAQDGSRRSAFYLGYRVFNGVGYWSFTMPAADTDDAEWIHAHSVSPVAVDGEWHHLAGVYDPAAKKIRLYVDGTLQAETAVATPWNAGSGFHIGGAKYKGAATDFWPGGIDDAQAYTGVLTDTEINEMGS
ncbi:LamG-like jellyroll fold domain-containing protein [Actinoallomurus vinaceus]|uniref:LamG-like jellyroll fold domain-containing protein n=1 Tax=Actinoallomurus vinaceus TaxID=1080074 RepID=UPI0031E93790